ncbi:mitochondrial carrier [Patellaria atrata CBS 101060]|uniref:Mitochondrial carrier n=1 Tax=Patellaria atrata CBS 101060 TaxID=1346257 RepID=A0A9P4SDY9_9PEZI|nr:mitochondrial carrier [Patellaria atrata CBS 101060]
MPEQQKNMSSPSGPQRTHPFLTPNEIKLFVQKHRTEVAASAASLVSTLVSYPLDSVKSRIQLYSYDNVADCIKKTYKTEGVEGFYRGVLSPLLSITLVRTVSFSVYQKSKYVYNDWITRATGVSPLVTANTKGAAPTLGTLVCFGAAGMTSGAMITAIACPFELTKLSAQISVVVNKEKGGIDEELRKSYQQKGTIRTAQNLIKHRGIQGLYCGARYHLIRDSLGTGIYFTTYESAKQLLGNYRGNSPTSPLAVVVAGGLCGLVSWACVSNLDLVTRHIFC